VDGTLSQPRTESPTNRRRSVAWGVLFGYAGVLLAVVRNIVLVPFYLRYVALAEYGAWLATGATLLQLLVSDFGLAGVLMQRSAALHGAGESRRLGELMGSGILAGLMLAAGLLVLGITAIAILPGMAGLTDTQSITVTRCLYLAVMAGALGILASIAQGLVRSLQRGAAAGSTALLAEVANITVSTLLLLGGAGLYALVWGMVVRSLLVAGASLLYLLRLCGPRLFFGGQRGEVRGLFADAGTSLVTSLAMKSQTQANTLLVGVILGPTSAAVYALTVRAHETVFSFLGQLNAAFAPAMAHLWGSGNTARFGTLLQHIVSGSALLAGLAMIGVVCANDSFVQLWLHGSIYGGRAVTILMAVAIWVSQIGFVAYDALYSLGKFRYIARTYVIVAVLHIVLLGSLLRFGLWIVPAVTVVTASLWGGIFWRAVSSDAQLAGSELKAIAADLLTIFTCGVVIAGLSLFLYSAADTWSGLLVRAACWPLAMLAAVLLVSGRIRTVLGGEIRMTVRSFLARHGA
jgi:O-antigen/teichoic acid export membrane protein